MALSNLNLYMNREDFSRYESAARIIKARVTFTPDDGTEAGEVLTGRLYRGNFLISETQVTLAGAHPKGYVFTFDLEEMTITPKTGFVFSNARFGEYHVEVENTGGSTAVSPKFWVLPVTADHLKQTRLFGMTLEAAEILWPVENPVNVTGVTVRVVSAFMAKGPHTLKYTSSTKTLQIGNAHDPDGDLGDAVTITPNQRIYVLQDSTIVSGEEYIIVDVDYFELPDDDQVDTLFIDSKRLPDDYVRFFIREAYGGVTRDLQIPLDPTWVTTDWADEEEWHIHYDPVAFERTREGSRFLAIETPVSRMLYLASLMGKLNDGNVIQMTDDWTVEYYRTGLIRMVPQTGAALQWLSQGIGLWWINSYGSVPAFWHFRALQGLPHLREEFSPALEAIMKSASLEIMVKAGSAYKAGFSSESVGRDGISASQSYTASATFGIYSADQEEYKKWRDEVWKKFKNSIRGPRFTVL